MLHPDAGTLPCTNPERSKIEENPFDVCHLQKRHAPEKRSMTHVGISFIRSKMCPPNLCLDVSKAKSRKRSA